MSEEIEHSDGGSLQPAQLERWLELQKEELAIKRSDQELRRQELDHSYQYATASLDAQLKDRQDARKEARRERRDGLYFLAFMLGAFLVFFFFLVRTGHKDFALELLKAGVYVFTSATGGYFAGKYRGEKQAERSAD